MGVGGDRMKRSWGPIEMLRKWPSFSLPSFHVALGEEVPSSATSLIHAI